MAPAPVFGGVKDRTAMSEIKRKLEKGILNSKNRMMTGGAMKKMAVT